MGLSFCYCGSIKGSCGCVTRQPVGLKTTTERGYGYDWQKLSRAYRVENPFCEVCLEKGKFSGVEEVHHRIAISVDRSQRLSYDNLQSVCVACHKEIEGGSANGGH